jgi:DNA mismatch endonuclease (patch repair protein)
MQKAAPLRSQIPAMYERGLSTRQIGREVGLSYHTVRSELLKAGVALRDHKDSAKRLPAEEVEKRKALSKLYESGMSIRQVSEETGMSAGVVASWLKRHGGALRSSAEGAALQGHTRNIPSREQLPEMYARGMSVNEIARAVGLSRGATHSILKVRGVEFRHQTESKRLVRIRYQAARQAEKQIQFEADQKARIEAETRGWSSIDKLNDEAWLRDQIRGNTMERIAEGLGCSPRAVTYACRRYGIVSPWARSEYQRLRAKEANFGNKHGAGSKRTPEQKARMSAAAIGKRGTNLGRKFTEEHKEKIRQSNLGQKRTPEARARMRAARMNVVLPVQDTLPERMMQEELRSRGVEFTTHAKLFGLPDIFLSPRTCVFVDGDYWHNRPDIAAKDVKVNRILREKGYTVLRYWEKDIKASASACVDNLLQEINENQT